MSLYPQPSPNEIPGLSQKQVHTTAKNWQDEPKAQILWQQLQDALRQGLTVSNILWSFRMTDWIVGLHATDIDGDGEIEILIASRDGRIRAFTRFGSLKWQRRLGRMHISALAVLPLKIGTQEEQPRIIVGLRSGNVIALDKEGGRIKDWEYDTGRIIRQISIGGQRSENVIIASEDRCIHVLESATGRPRWKYHTQGWVRCVLARDIDGDGEEEILGGSGDKHLYIFDTQGNLLHDFDTGHQVYALATSPVETAGPVRIILSSNRKDLSAWEVTRSDGIHWKHEMLWVRPSAGEERVIGNRGHSICVQDIDGDGMPEILVGSEDGYLVVTDYHGQLLWKQNFRSCVYRLSATDINRDGQVEILVGTENHYAYVLQLDLVKDLNKRIRDFYAQLTQLCLWTWNQIAEKLTVRESMVLKDFVEESPSRPPRMELEEGKRLMQKGEYKSALAIFLRLLQENIQYCWSQPFTTQGYVWTECLNKLSDNRGQNLVIGTDQGYIYNLDTRQEMAQPIWEEHFNEHAPYRVRMLCSGPETQTHQISTVAVLSDYRIALLDNQGRVVQYHSLKSDTEDWARCAYYYPGSESEASAIIIGMENNKIAFWDEELRAQIGQIAVPQGIGAVYAYDILGIGKAQIISGTLKNRVYAHTWDGQELWYFETRDRVQALHVADIDKDGRAEIIVGAEDRNVYVLDDEGHLKWRYRTMRGVMDIDVCDIKMERDSNDPKERTQKILVSSSDGYLYMFNADGDLIWKYQTPNRARVVRAGDMNADGLYEIAIAFENQLELLQMLDRDDLIRLSDVCWEKLTANYTDWAAIRELTEEPDEYIRGRALARLIGLSEHTEEDFRHLLKVQREDKSLQVKRDLVRGVVNLYRLPNKHEENMRQARLLLERLYQDPEEEIRHEILKILPLLEERFSFEYLERSIEYPDIWVRQAVVKRLDQLIKKYPQQTFPLLLKTARSEEEWVRQETGRALAHYFEAHVEHLIPDLLTLLEQETDLIVLQQLVYSANHPALKGFFMNLLRQLKVLRPENMADILDEAIHWISAVNELGPFSGEELLQIYEEFRQLLNTKTISAIAGYQRVTRSDILNETPGSLAGPIVPVFDALEETARIVGTYERRQTIGERVSSLIQAGQTLEKVHGDLRQQVLKHAQGHQMLAYFPASHILLFLVEQWSAIISAELARMSGSANLVCELGNTTVPRSDEVTIVLRVRNTGQCAADNVCIELEESANFEILEEKQHKWAEVSTSAPRNVSFLLHLHTSSARLVFHLTYDDAEGRGKKWKFADTVVVQEYQHPYHHIANPYTTGTPILDKKMFYGRTEDLEFLRESLGSVSANRVVLLWGQRRMGKTSLIYQLANELAVGPYAPVFIDLQKLALQDTPGQLLESFAKHIAREIWQRKKTWIADPVHEQFLSDPSSAFYEYLSDVLQYLPNHRIILIIDEFDGMRKYGENILYYLRTLMQHYPGLNFLLSGAPQMPYMEGYQSVFFNIAQERRLGKLKPEEAYELIADPVRADLEYDALALERMLELTDGWPYFIHVMSEKLIRHCNTIQKSYVTIGEVNAALDQVLEGQESSIHWIWQDLSSPIEKLALSLLAQEREAEGRVFALNDIRRAFDEYGVPYEQKDVREALNKLKRGDFVAEKFDGSQYYIPVGLLKAWLRKEKPPERVVREENFYDG